MLALETLAWPAAKMPVIVLTVAKGTIFACCQGFPAALWEPSWHGPAVLAGCEYSRLSVIQVCQHKAVLVCCKLAAVCRQFMPASEPELRQHVWRTSIGLTARAPTARAQVHIIQEPAVIMYA